MRMSARRGGGVAGERRLREWESWRCERTGRTDQPDGTLMAGRGGEEGRSRAEGRHRAAGRAADGRLDRLRLEARRGLAGGLRRRRDVQVLKGGAKVGLGNRQHGWRSLTRQRCRGRRRGYVHVVLRGRARAEWRSERGSAAGWRAAARAGTRTIRSGGSATENGSSSGSAGGTVEEKAEREASRSDSLVLARDCASKYWLEPPTEEPPKETVESADIAFTMPGVSVHWH